MQIRQRQKRRVNRAKTNQPTPAHPSGTQMIAPRRISAYPSVPESVFPTTMSTTTTTTKKGVKSHKGNSANYAPPTPTPPAGRQIMIPRGIKTYQSLPDRQFPTTVSATTMTTNKKRKSYKRNSTQARSSHRETDDSAQRYYNRPIHYQKVITDEYDCDENE